MSDDSSKSGKRPKSSAKHSSISQRTASTYNIKAYNKNPLLRDLQEKWDESGIGVTAMCERADIPQRRSIADIWVSGALSDIRTSTYLKLLRGLEISIPAWPDDDVNQFLKRVSVEPNPPDIEKAGEQYTIQHWNMNPMLLELQIHWHESPFGISDFAKKVKVSRQAIFNLFITASTNDTSLNTYLRMFRALGSVPPKKDWNLADIDKYLSSL